MTRNNARTGRQLIADDPLFDQLAKFTRDRFGLAKVNAIRAVDQGIILVHYALLNPEKILSPSKAVDLGVDAFVLHMPEYREFCFRVGGQLLDHIPRKGNGAKRAPGDQPITGPFATASLLRATGDYLVDASMWPHTELDPDCCFMCTGGPNQTAVQGTLAVPVRR